ncbi:MAG: spondin domain-containing protein [Archangiaceae bacterium]|nr:spondin domain-containing protein [Archangiaceae bacterium]
MLRPLLSSLLLCAACAGSVGGDDMMQPPAPTTFRVRLANISPFKQLKSGAFAVKTGATAPGPLAPGDAFEVGFSAGPGQKLAFATMFGQSNDWVFATPASGIDLYSGDSKAPISGDVTSQISLYDVGTEIDEEPAVGPHTGPNQATSGDGPGANDPIARVRKLGGTVMLTSGAMFTLPPVASMIRVTLTPRGGTDFTLRIQNVANDTSTLMTSQGYKPVRLSPGVWALTAGGEALFTDGVADRNLGLEDIAEMGSPARLAASLKPLTGFATPISPGLLAVHTGGAPFFTVGEKDRGMGLERIAEDGFAMPLRTAMGNVTDATLKEVKLFDTPVGRDTTGPAKPGSAYEIEISAVPGDRLSLVTMYGWSNDWVFATPENGIDLFDGDQPRFGPLTEELHVYDVGSELSEEPFIGPNTGPQQSGPDVGPLDTDTRVRIADYTAPVSTHLSVSLVKP